MDATLDITSSLRARLGALLEAMLNQALRLDPDLAAELESLEGRSIALTWSAPQWSLRITVEHGALRIGPNRGPSDLALSASLPGLLGLLRPTWSQALPAGRVTVAGDVDLLRRIERVAKRFAPDWDSAFARRLGPTIGPQIGRALGAGLRFALERARSLAETTSEYLLEEGRDVATRDELNTFADEVDRLRDDVERLQARLDRLEQAKR